MGIRGLAGFLKWKLPQSRRNLSWASWSGKTWAIDISCILYRARSAELEPITVVAYLLSRMRAFGITPIVVFDGKPPNIKSNILDQRRDQREAANKEVLALEHILDVSADMSHMDKALTEKRISELNSRNPVITGSDKDLIKQLLYGAGVLFISASGEADDILGLLARTNRVDAVVSTDTDMLARGVPTLIYPEVPDISVLTEIHTEKILTLLDLTYEQFIDACVLMGTDYTGNKFKTRPPAEAVASVKRGDPFLEHDRSIIEVAKASLMGTDKTLEQLLNPYQLAKFLQGAPTREPDTLTTMSLEYDWPADWSL